MAGAGNEGADNHRLPVIRQALRQRSSNLTLTSQHRLFFSQVELCDNLIIDRRAGLDALGERLFDANRTIGQPKKLAASFGRKVAQRSRGKLEPLIEDLDLPNPVIRSSYRDGSIKTICPRPPPAPHRARPALRGSPGWYARSLSRTRNRRMIDNFLYMGRA